MIPVPIAVMSGAPGPTALLVAGVHGDEYEGPRRAAPRAGRPGPGDAHRTGDRAAGAQSAGSSGGAPGVADRRRKHEPRLPGRPGWRSTAQIAHYVEAGLLPQLDVALDLHAGGKASEYLPCAYVYEGGPEDAAKRALPTPLVPNSPCSSAARRRRGRSRRPASGRASPMIAAELDGGGRLSREALAVAEAGVWRCCGMTACCRRMQPIWTLHPALAGPGPAPIPHVPQERPVRAGGVARHQGRGGCTSRLDPRCTGFGNGPPRRAFVAGGDDAGGSDDGAREEAAVTPRAVHAIRVRPSPRRAARGR